MVESLGNTALHIRRLRIGLPLGPKAVGSSPTPYLRK